MVWVFDVKVDGRNIHLSDKQWKHIINFHPNVENPEKIKEALLDPLFIKKDSLDVSLNYY